MIHLKPNGPPLCGKQEGIFLSCLLVFLISVLWCQPIAFAEAVDDLEVEGGLMETVEPVINKITHRSEGDADIFTLSYRGEVPEPSVETEADGLWATFEGCHVDLPAGSEGRFSTPVQGRLIGRLDVFVDEEGPTARIGLIPLAGTLFSNDISFTGEGEIEIRCQLTTPLREEEIAPPVEEPAGGEPEPLEFPETYTPPASEAAKIVKVKYDPVGDIDRFTFCYEGPTPEVEVFSLRYPDRLKVNMSPAEVDLPAHSGGRFETPVPGIGIAKMEAVNIDSEAGRDASFTFSVALSSAIDDLDIKVDASLPDRIVVDVLNSAIPAPEPVEAAPPIDEPEPAIEPEPVPEPITGPEPEIEAPAVEEVTPEAVAEIDIEPEPLAPDRMSIGVNISPAPDNGVILHIRGDKPFSEPMLKKLSYPTRVSLTLPYSSIGFRGDESGDWVVKEGPVSKLRAGDYVTEDEYMSSLFVYVDSDMEADRVVTDIQPAGLAAYDIYINLKPEMLPPIVIAEAPAVVPGPAPAVPEPVAEPEETAEPSGTNIEIAVEAYIEPAPAFMPPVEPVEEPAPPAGEEVEPTATEVAETIEVEEIEIEEPEWLETSGEAIAMLSPLTEDVEVETIHYRDFPMPMLSVECKPHEGNADRFVINSTGPIEDPDINRLDFPPRLVLLFDQAATESDDPNPYDYKKVDGGVIANRYKFLFVEDGDSAKSILEIDAASAESSDEIGFDISRSAGGLILDVYRAPGEEMLAALPGEPEPLAMEEETIPSSPEPVSLEEVLEERIEEAAEKPEALAKPSAAEAYVDVFNVKDANIVDVLQVICAKAGISNIVDPSVTGRVSLSLQERMPLEAILDLLGDQANFDYYIKHGVYIFASPKVLETKFPEFFGTWIIELSYADPNQVKNILSAQGIIEARNMIVYNPPNVGMASLYSATRMLLLRGTEKDLKLAFTIVKEIDKPPVQILYDVKVIQTSANIAKGGGVAWLTEKGGTENIGTLAFRLEEKPEYITKGDFLPQGFIRDTFAFTATINYLDQEGKAKILANPTITALNGQPADYFVGQVIPYRSTFQVSDIGRVTQRVATESIGVTLRIIGFAASNDTVTMFISPSLSNLLELTDIGPRTSNNRFSTSLRCGDGETFIMAGLINEEDRITFNKVPVLGDLPLFGGLFRNKKTDLTRSELIIAITPHIIKPVEYKGPVVRRATEFAPLLTGGK